MAFLGVVATFLFGMPSVANATIIYSETSLGAERVSTISPTEWAISPLPAINAANTYYVWIYAKSSVITGDHTFLDFQDCPNSVGTSIIVGMEENTVADTYQLLKGTFPATTTNLWQCGKFYLYRSSGTFTVKGAGGTPFLNFMIIGTEDNDIEEVDFTRIISTDPRNREVVSATTTVGVEVYVDPDDWVAGTVLTGNFVNRTVTVYPQTYAIDALDAVESDIVFPLQSGYNASSTTMHFDYQGDYDAYWRVESPNRTFLVGAVLEDELLYSTSTRFTVGSSTPLDIIMSSTTEVLITALLTGTTTAQSIVRCNPADFDITICLLSLIVPPNDVLAQDFARFRNGLLSKFPIGYLSRVVDIMSTTTTRHPGVITIDLPWEDLQLNVWSYLSSTSTFATATSSIRVAGKSIGTGQTLRQAIETEWELLWLFGVGAFILRDILAHRKS